MGRFLVPEVVQTSGMDCGPACLKALLEGSGISASYGRLREACQTDVDGSSIDHIETAAGQLGLDAAQEMQPIDHLLLREADALPAMVVVRLANGTAHFVIAWRKAGGFLQLMDPAVGRHWIGCRRFLESAYLHTQTVPMDAWREWAAGDTFVKPLRTRLAALGLGAQRHRRGRHCAALIRSALADPGWRKLAALDAAVRMITALVHARVIRRGAEAGAMLDRLLLEPETISETYWSVLEDTASGALLMRGAITLHVRGRQAHPEPVESLSPDLAAALTERPNRPWRLLLGLLRGEGFFGPAALCAAFPIAAATVVMEATLLRGLLAVGRDLTVTGQRVGAIAALLAFLAVPLVLEWPLTAGLLRVGRKLETRLRVRFLEKIPRLGDTYFRSRLMSDMAERSHSAHTLRNLPELTGKLLRASFELLFTVLGIAWLYPESAPLACLVAVAAAGIPLAAQPLLTERDSRWRNHTGALIRFYLSALEGLTAIRAHGAQAAVRREQEELLSLWAAAGLRAHKLVAAIDGAQSMVAFGLVAWLLMSRFQQNTEAAGVLLLTYWALNLPALGQEIAALAWQYPGLRNTTLRLIEPLGAREEEGHAPEGRSETCPIAAPGPSIEFRGVSVVAAGRPILEDVHIRIPAGAHVGIVGPSGAGKSSLVGLLLGWHRPACGEILIDGRPLDAARLEQLRGEIAWVDPQVRLWNRPLLENLLYGVPCGAAVPVDRALDAAHLRDVLRKLPEGMQSALGEGGALVSGGEGQRVRMGRAMLRPGVRLVILDEPCRGLDRGLRRAMIERARELWRDATILTITHDVSDTLDFDRVLVIENGRVAEDGNPMELSRTESRYRALLDAEDGIRRGLWASNNWRRFKLEDGRLEEQERKEAACRNR